MKSVLTSPVIWTAAACLIFYFIIAAFISPTPLIENLRLIQMSTAVAVVIAYSPFALDAIRARRPDRVQQLSMGIALGFSSILLNGLWAFIWRTSGKPAWMYDSDVSGFIIWLAILAATLHITAPGAINGIVPKRNLIVLGLAVGAGVFAAGLILTLNPNFHDLAEALEPYLRDRSGWVQDRPGASNGF